MKLRKISIVLLALLLAAMAMVPMVSAGKLIPSQQVIGMKYFQDSPINELAKELTAPEASNIPSTLSEYALVTVDSKAFMRDADTKKQVEFSLKGKDYRLNLWQIPSPISKNATLIVGDSKSGHMEKLPRIITYQGVVIDGENGDALFTVSDNVLLGKITIENTSYIIDQLGPGMRDDGKVVHVIYDSGKFVADPTLKPAHDKYIFENPISGEKYSSGFIHQDNTRSPLTTTYVDLFAAYDPLYRVSYSNPTQEIADMISQANTAFSPCGVSISIAAYREVTDLNPMQSEDLLRDFRTKYSAVRDSTSSDLAFLFTGKNLPDANGISFVYSGSATSGWALGQMVNKPGSNYSGSFGQRNILIAHEMGHNFGALHDGMSVTQPLSARPYHWTELFIFDRYTALWDPWQGDNMRLEFSSPTGHGDSTHNNVAVITTNKGTVAGYR